MQGQVQTGRHQMRHFPRLLFLQGWQPMQRVGRTWNAQQTFAWLVVALRLKRCQILPVASGAKNASRVLVMGFWPCAKRAGVTYVRTALKKTFVLHLTVLRMAHVCELRRGIAFDCS